MNIFKCKHWVAILGIALLPSLVACGNPDQGGDAGPPPAATITVQPTDQTVVAGTAASFSVVASNVTGYQWQRSTDNGATYQDLSGATQATYTTPPITLGDNGQRFRVIVAGAANSVISSAVTLTVTAATVAPAITVHPVDQTVTAGQNASFSVTATGTSLSYQWQRSTDNGTTYQNLSGATQASYTTPATTLTDNGQRFRMVVSNSAGSVTSNAALLTVNAATVAPAYTTHPANVTVTEPTIATFSVAVTGTPTPTLQWQLSIDNGSNWSNINGATAASYTTPPTVAADSGKQYRVVASNSAGSATSNAATLTVNPASSTNAVLVSVTSSGVVSNLPTSEPSVSADGRWIAFMTVSNNPTNLVADGCSGALLHDMATRVTTRINVRPDGGCSSQSPTDLKLAADGQHAVFTSFANDLVTGDTNGALDVFVRNLQTGVTTRENVLPDGSQDSVSGNTNHPFPPDISADGRWVLMWSGANLTGTGNWAGNGLYLRDRQSGVTRAVVTPGTPVAGASLAASGQYVVYLTNSGSGASYTHHLRLYDVAQNTTSTLLSVLDNNNSGSIHGGVSVSDDGRFVACAIRSATLAGAAATYYQVVVLDRNLADPVAGMELVSVTDAGDAGSGEHSTRPQLSGDGRYVLFASRATNLAVERYSDTLLVRDRQAGTTRIASRRIDGTPASGGFGIRSEALSRNGALVVFTGEMHKIVDPASTAGTQIFRVGRP